MKHSDLSEFDNHQLPRVLCEATDAIVQEHVKGAQLINGIWTICLKSEYARNFLIEGEYSLQIRNPKIPIYKKYPIVSRRPFTEKVLFKDTLFHVSDEDLLEYIYSQPNIKIQTKRVIAAQIINHKRE